MIAAPNSRPNKKLHCLLAAAILSLLLTMSPSRASLRLVVVLLLSLFSCGVHSFAPTALLHQRRAQASSHLCSSIPSSTEDEYTKIDTKIPTEDWELDCYSRPVLVNGKKLWEVLLTDSNGSFKYRKALPSNQVNSRELRKVVEQVMDDAEVKPTTIRFFRGAMFNMVC